MAFGKLWQFDGGDLPAAMHQGAGKRQLSHHIAGQPGGGGSKPDGKVRRLPSGSVRTGVILK